MNPLSTTQNMNTLSVPKVDQIATSEPGYFEKRHGPNATLNKVFNLDSGIHNWYRFVLSFPPHLVRDYLDAFKAQPGQTMLDPFCGTGTTLIEAKKKGLHAVGVEANPVPHLAASIKTSWTIDAHVLLESAVKIAKLAERKIRFARKLKTLSDEKMELLLDKSISPLPLHKTLTLLEVIKESTDAKFSPYWLVALAKTAVATASNLHFGPEVGVRGYKKDANVIGAWLAEVQTMSNDLATIERQGKKTKAKVHLADARNMFGVLAPNSVDFVFTSPPYPNEKDYTRATRLESVLLGYLNTKKDLRSLKDGLLRSNTRNAFKGDEDDLWVADNQEVQRIAKEIENRRIELRKTSGFEKNYARVTKLYFGGMAKHFADLRSILKPGAMLGYVVGDQASYLRVMIRTGQILGDIAVKLGYELVGIDLFRTRLATATKEQLREEVVVLRWPGK